MRDRLADVLDKHLLCGQATAGEMNNMPGPAARAERDNPGRAFLERHKVRHETLLAAEMELLCPDDAQEGIGGARIAVAVGVLRRHARGPAVVPPPRKGRPLAWGRRWLWPYLRRGGASSGHSLRCPSRRQEPSWIWLPRCTALSAGSPQTAASWPAQPGISTGTWAFGSRSRRVSGPEPLRTTITVDIPSPARPAHGKSIFDFCHMRELPPSAGWNSHDWSSRCPPKPHEPGAHADTALSARKSRRRPT